VIHTVGTAVCSMIFVRLLLGASFSWVKGVGYLFFFLNCFWWNRSPYCLYFSSAAPQRTVCRPSEDILPPLRGQSAAPQRTYCRPSEDTLPPLRGLNCRPSEDTLPPLRGHSAAPQRIKLGRPSEDNCPWVSLIFL
jgi:hypothetical protein